MEMCSNVIGSHFYLVLLEPLSYVVCILSFLLLFLKKLKLIVGSLSGDPILHLVLLGNIV